MTGFTTQFLQSSAMSPGWGGAFSVLGYGMGFGHFGGMEPPGRKHSQQLLNFNMSYLNSGATKVYRAGCLMLSHMQSAQHSGSHMPA